MQSYFLAHPGEFLDLKRIAQPLSDLRAQCGVAVSPGQLAALVESFQYGGPLHAAVPASHEAVGAEGRDP